MAGLAGLVWAVPTAARAAQPIFQAPELVWETTGRTSGPQIVVDAAGRAHLFFQDATEAGAAMALYHVNLDGGPPYAANDVVVGLETDSRDYRTAADPFGNVHVLYSRQRQLWHLWAAGGEAHDAGSWTEPVNVGSTGPGPEIAIDQQGRVFVCFPRADEVRYVRSDDGGSTWGQDALVATSEYPAIPAYLACAVDKAGAIHVSWAEAEPPNFYPSKSVRYARSDDDGASWSDPEVVAGEHYTLPELLADGSGTVHMLWQADIGLGGRQYRRLEAGADDWSPVETVVPVGRGGMSGDAPLAVDGDGGVHAVTSAPEPVWVGRGAAGWGAPVELAAALADEPNATGSVENPAFAIQSGNVAYVAFAFDFKRIYYVAGLLDAATVAPTLNLHPSLDQLPMMAARTRRPLRAEAADEREGAIEEASDSITATVSAEAEDVRRVEVAVPMSAPRGGFDQAPWGAARPARWLLWVGPGLAMLLVASVVLRRMGHR